jgi:hypothetical protein
MFSPVGLLYVKFQRIKTEIHMTGNELEVFKIPFAIGTSGCYEKTISAHLSPLQHFTPITISKDNFMTTTVFHDNVLTWIEKSLRSNVSHDLPRA